MSKTEKIIEISSSSEYIQEVIKLADSASNTLGFMPRGAFIRLADQGQVIGYINEENKCIGYILYNTNNLRVKLNHLCVNKEYRGRGIAKKLLDYLKNKTSHLEGINLSCRRDYHLEGMWEYFGFSVVSERPGRSKQGSILTEWFLSYGYPNLITLLSKQRATSKTMPVVIDANIFFDLISDNPNDQEGRESMGLMADWILSEIELCLTDEIRNEINRSENDNKRRTQLNKVDEFAIISHDHEHFDKIQKELQDLYPKEREKTISDYSDIRHLSKVISSEIDVSYFITRDTKLPEEVQETVFKKYGLTIIEPTDFIIRLNQLRQESEYQPIRLDGTNLEKRLVASGSTNAIIDRFLGNSFGERKANFQRDLKRFLADPDNYECFTIKSKDENFLALIVIDRSIEGELNIPIFRFQKHILQSIIIKHCLFQFSLTAAKEKRNFIKITERFLDESVKTIFQEDYFIESNNTWMKMLVPLVVNANEFSAYLKTERFDNYLSELSRIYKDDVNKDAILVDLLENDLSLSNTELMSLIERILFPVKIVDANIDTYIIPIQAWFAFELFDKDLANDVLWGARDDLALQRENVYYKSKKGSGLNAPARILWYVSESKSGKEFPQKQKLGTIRACSSLDQIMIDRPKQLYKRFRRLGVFDFKQVLKVANNNIDQDIMAIKFSSTELFVNPINRDQIYDIIGKTHTFQAPFKISREYFSQIYSLGNPHNG